METAQYPMVAQPQYIDPGMNNFVPVMNQPAYQPEYQQYYDGRYALTYRKSASIWIGTILILCGAVSIIGGIRAIMYNSPYSFVGNGIWVGAVVVIAGSVALAAACNPTDRIVYAATALAFISLGFCVLQIFVSSASSRSQFFCIYCYNNDDDDDIDNRNNYYHNHHKNKTNNYDHDRDRQEEIQADIADGLMVASAIVAGILSLSLGIVNSMTISNNSGATSQNQVVPAQVQYPPAPPGQYTGQPQMVAQVPPGQFNEQPVYYYMDPNQQYQQQ